MCYICLWICIFLIFYSNFFLYFSYCIHVIFLYSLSSAFVLYSNLFLLNLFIISVTPVWDWSLQAPDWVCSLDQAVLRCIRHCFCTSYYLPFWIIDIASEFYDVMISKFSFTTKSQRVYDFKWLFSLLYETTIIVIRQKSKFSAQLCSLNRWEEIIVIQMEICFGHRAVPSNTDLHAALCSSLMPLFVLLDRLVAGCEG